MRGNNVVNRNNYSLFNHAIFECQADSFRVIFRRNNNKARVACKYPCRECRTKYRAIMIFC